MSDRPEIILHQILKRWIRRLRLQRAILGGLGGWAVGSASALTYLAYALISGNILSEEYVRFTIITAGLSTFFGLLAAYFWPISLQPAARKFDRIFDLKERVSTALEIENGTRKTSLREAQLSDTVESAAGVDLHSAMPLRFPRLALVLIVLFTAANIALFSYGDTIFKQAASKRQTLSLIQEQAEKIENLIEEIQENEDLTLQQKDALTQPLEQSLEKISETETLEEAFSALEEAQEELKSLENPDMAGLVEQMSDVGETLAESGSDALSSLGVALTDGDLNQVAQVLNDLAGQTLSPEELVELAAALTSLADAAALTDPELAAQLREAASAAQEGNSEAAQDALAQAAENFENLSQQMAASQAAQQASSQLGDSQDTLVSAGQQSQDGTPSSGSQGSAGSSTAGANTGAGSGAGEGTGNQENAAGSEAGSTTISQGNNPDGAGETIFQPISASSLGGAGGDWIAVPPSGIEGDNITGVGPTDPGSNAPMTMPYSEVFPQYQQTANQAIDSGIIPPQYRDLIRSYFSSLAP